MSPGSPADRSRRPRLLGSGELLRPLLRVVVSSPSSSSSAERKAGGSSGGRITGAEGKSVSGGRPRLARGTSSGTGSAGTLGVSGSTAGVDERDVRNDGSERRAGGSSGGFVCGSTMKSGRGPGGGSGL